MLFEGPQITHSSHSLTSSHSHSGLMAPSVSVVLPALIVSNLFLDFSNVGVRFFARVWGLNTALLDPMKMNQNTQCYNSLRVRPSPGR